MICCSQPESTVEFLCRPVRLSCGQQHTAVVSSSGDVYTWGRSQKGRYILKIMSIFMNIARIKLESHNYINNYCSFYLIRFFPYLRLGVVLMMIRCYYGTHLTFAPCTVFFSVLSLFVDDKFIFIKGTWRAGRS